MQIFDRREALFCFHEFRDQFHRARPIERDQRDDVVEFANVELLRQTGHAARFHLEEADCVAAVVEGEGCGIIERNLLQRKIQLAFVNERHGLLDRGECFEPKEIHLEQAEIIERPHRILADDVVTFHVSTKRDVIGKIAIADHHTGRVHAGVTRQTLQDFCVLEKLTRGCLARDCSFQLRIFLHR